MKLKREFSPYGQNSRNMYRRDPLASAGRGLEEVKWNSNLL